MVNIPTVTLNNGIEMPQLGLGVFQIPDLEECEATVSSALSNGYRLIDTAASYGNEEAVGKAIRSSGIPRDEIFLVTKVWITDNAEGKARKAFENSLEKLGMDYVDAYLIHQPFNDPVGAWRDLETIYDEKLARSIGVSNHAPDQLMNLSIFANITPAINQIELHPHNQQQQALETMRELGVQPMSWGPFAEGRNDLFTEPTLTEIAERYGKSPAQIMLRWQMQRGIVAIPKSVRPERQAENIEIFDFDLKDEDMAAIAKLDRKVSSYFDHRDPEVVKWLSGATRNT